MTGRRRRTPQDEHHRKQCKGLRRSAVSSLSPASPPSAVTSLVRCSADLGASSGLRSGATRLSACTSPTAHRPGTTCCAWTTGRASPQAGRSDRRQQPRLGRLHSRATICSTHCGGDRVPDAANSKRQRRECRLQTRIASGGWRI